MSIAPDAAMRARREAKIQEHIAAENRFDVEATLATMHEAHYDVVPWGLVVDGRDNVREFLERLLHDDAGHPHRGDPLLPRRRRARSWRPGRWAPTRARSRASRRTADRSR